MKLAIFGGTGKTGQLLVQQALAGGHSLTALARTPSKLTLEHANLEVIQGDATDPAAAAQTIRGADAVISALGPTRGAPALAVTRAVETITQAMLAGGVNRILFVSGAGVGDPNDAPTPADRIIGFLIKMFSPAAYADMHAATQVMRASSLDWTIVRAPMLTDDPSTGVISGYLGKGVGMRLSRADLAAFLLEQVTSPDFVCKAPVISSRVVRSG